MADDKSEPIARQAAKPKGRHRPQDPPAFLVAECFALDPASPTGLRWRQRPKWHFRADRSWLAWNSRYAQRPVNGCPNDRGELRVGLTLCGRSYMLPTRRVAVVLQSGTWPRPMRRGRP
jgi:hypothetical protein